MKTDDEMRARRADERARLERMIDGARNASWANVPDKGRYLTELAALGGSVRTLDWILGA